MQDMDTQYECCLIEYIVEKVKEQGLTHTEFAAQVWPDISRTHAFQKWKNMRLGERNTGKRQGLLIRDARKMAIILGVELSYLLLQATIRFEKDK